MLHLTLFLVMFIAGVACAQRTQSVASKHESQISTLFPSHLPFPNLHTIDFGTFKTSILYNEGVLAFAFFVPTKANSISQDDLKNEVEAFVSLLNIERYHIYPFDTEPTSCFMLTNPSGIPTKGISRGLAYHLGKPALTAVTLLSELGKTPPTAWLNGAPVWKIEPIGEKHPISVSFSIDAEYLTDYVFYVDNARPISSTLYRYLNHRNSFKFSQTASTNSTQIKTLKLMAKSDDWGTGNKYYLYAVTSSKAPYTYIVTKSISSRRKKNTRNLLSLEYPTKIESTPQSKLALNKESSPASSTTAQKEVQKPNYTKSSAMEAWLKELKVL